MRWMYASVVALYSQGHIAIGHVVDAGSVTREESITRKKVWRLPWWMSGEGDHLKRNGRLIDDEVD
jgi:hypothetical protein